MKIKFYSFISMMLFGSIVFGQATISDCGDFEAGPNTTWTHVFVACTADDGNTGEAQTLDINVTSLPDDGANWRPVKTVSNGNWYTGAPATPLSLGVNTLTVAGVDFARGVKFQFSSGNISFDSLVLNGESASSCLAAPESGTAISECVAFEEGPNTTWTDVLTACTIGDGNDGAAQTFTLNITSLPEGGANYRVVKTVANGNWNNGAATALTLGTNTKTVTGVEFDRTVKFQFSSGDVEFSSLTLNGEDVACIEEPVADTGIVFDGVFGGSYYDESTSTYTVPTGSESWAGFANQDTEIYPLTFGTGGSISFTASVPSGGNADVNFRLEANPYPDTEPSFTTDAVTIQGSTPTEYTIDIPSQGNNTFSSFLFYVNTPDEGVVMTNVEVTTSETTGAPEVSYVTFAVDMTGVDYPNADYDQVTVNGSWNGWNGWGVPLADTDNDGIFTGGAEFPPFTTFEYVVAVSGVADGYSGWGMQWGDGCENANVIVTTGEADSVTETSLTAGCGEVLGCLDQNASNFNADATEQGYDQYGNLQCIYASCDDVPGDGCIYADGFGYFNDEFGPDLCVTYGGTPCGGGCDDLDNDGICDDEDSCVGSQASGVRYIDEVFNCVDVTSNVVYGQNVTVLPLLQGAPPSAQPLVCDIYQPEGDTEENRPLIIYIHTGNFLPQYLNGSAVGTKTDNVAVELCTRFARMGYVVASIDYRTGWNPLAATQSDRTFQLINAAYRGVQDARTAVRYFRMNADVMGNEYNIDPANIGYFGEGTGGYVSYAASTISDYNDIILDDTGMPIAKFWTGTPGSADYIPMVIAAVNGDPEAKFDGYAPAGVFGPDPVQLCIGQYPDYSSDIQFQMNMGGALGDLNWLDQGDAPMVSFQCPHDQFAPYTTDVLVVPTTNELVVEVSGAYDVHAEINGYPSPNNNVSFQSANLTDDLSLEALNNGGFDGMYPVLNNYDNGTPTEPFDGAPWQWWDVAAAEAYDAANGTTIAATQLPLNPTMSEVEAMYWIDVIQGYTAPRLALAFGVADIGPGCVDETACNFNALATSDDGSCTYADAGFDCEGNSLNIEGCTNPFACDYNPAATVDTGCTYLTGNDVPTGTDNVWLVGLTVTGTPFEAFAGGCEAAGGVNPNLSINGVIVGDGSAPLTLAGVTDPTGLLADLVALTSTVEFSACGANMTVSALGNLIPMVGNGQFWISPIPVNEDGQYLWAGPMMNFDMGCGDPTACNFSGNPCELSIDCSYPGCADVNAANYDAGAGCPDNTLCIYLGCTDPNAFNYDENATDDDGTCVPVIEGCTNTEASNWDATANTDDGSCELDGCTYEDANNYDADATNDDGSCEFSLGNDCIGDLNGDGVAATSDLLLFLSVFGQSCE